MLLFYLEVGAFKKLAVFNSVVLIFGRKMLYEFCTDYAKSLDPHPQSMKFGQRDFMNCLT
jgi:hypothetical protein